MSQILQLEIPFALKEFGVEGAQLILTRGIEDILKIELSKRTAKNARKKIKRKVVQFFKQDGLCWGCDKEISDLGAATWDHIKPQYFGGRTEPSNLILMHADCNSLKSKCQTVADAEAIRDIVFAGKKKSKYIRQNAELRVQIMSNLVKHGIIAE